MPKNKKGKAIVVEAQLVTDETTLREQLIQAQESIREATLALQLAYRAKAELYIKLGREDEAITQLTKAGKIREILRGL